ncbi:MAG: SRPBCC family protein [Methylobacter sp.]|nr:SRPBCC family protein [Methylobacter sp.]
MPHCYQSIVVNAPVDKVWDAIRNFHDMSWAASAIEKCEVVGEKSGTETGAKRVLNDAFHETLIECNDQEHIVRYSIDDGPSPVSSAEVNDYIGTLHLIPATLNNSTFVEWSSNWESNSEDAAEFCHQIYVTLLRALAGQLESK